jgi:hypothetical protein
MNEDFVRVEKCIKGEVVQCFEDGICIHQMFVAEDSLENITYRDNWGNLMLVEDVPELPNIPIKIIQVKE